MQEDRSVRQALITAAMLLIFTPAMGQELADIHAQRRERGLNCFTDHFHYGSSAGQSSKRAAQITAVQSWVDFVNFEYGRAWTSWPRSVSKSISCTRAGDGGWGCDVSSRPCRR